MFANVIRHGTLLTVGILIFCVLGISAALRAPVQMIPDLEVRTITVDTRWPGATPQDVEQEILIEQEQYLRTLPNLERMMSQAQTGRAIIELKFPFGVDINEALIRVNNALSQVPAYPQNVDEPRLYSSSFSDNAFMYFRIVARDGNPLKLDLNVMRDFVDDYVRPRMERAPGVSEVSLGGGASRQMRIHVDPTSLAERGLSLTAVRDAIRERNRDSSGGDIDSGKRRYLVRTVGRFQSQLELENLILARRGDSIIRLRDVASVELEHAELRGQSYSRGQPTLSLSVRREAGSNVIAIKEALLPIVDELNRGVLSRNGLEMFLVTDDVRYVEDSVANVLQNLALGAVLATLVIYLFLRSAGATLVAVLGIPICTLAAFLGLLSAGRTINVISLAGIAFAIGMTVDNTIVVLESIEQARRRGLQRFDAAVAGVREVWPAVLASTLTTVLVFAPVLFIAEEAGQLYSDVAIAIAASILASMLVAITLVPSASARLGFGGRSHVAPPDQRLRERIEKWVDALTATRTRRWSCIASTVAAVIAVAVFLTPAAEYLPEGEEPKIFANMLAPPGYNLTEMMAIADRLNEELTPLLDAEPSQFENGKARYPALRSFNLSVTPQRINIVAETKEPSQIDALMLALNARFREVPGMRAFSSRGSIISSSDGGTRSVNLDIAGADLGTLYAVADAAYLRAQQLFENPQINSDPSSLSLDQPLVQIRPRWERLAELGFTAQDFGFAVAALSDGAFVDEYFEGDDKIDIFVYSSAGSQQQLDRLRGMPVYAPNGTVAPLDALADIVETVDSDIVRRVDGRRTVTLNIVPPRSVALETAVAAVNDQLIPGLQRDGLVPSGVSLDVSGAADQLDATRESLSSNFLIAVVLSYLLLVAIFTHWGYPLLILATVPMGVAGGILGLALLNLGGGLLPLVGLAALRQPFDMITMLGFLILLGLVVNNPILIVDRARSGLQQGLSAVAAVREAVASRLRPILMSSLTTGIGLSPLVFIPGAGAELYRGVGVVVLAGLLCSVVVTLTFLPCLLIVVLSRSRARDAAGSASPQH
ncbi:MAG: efflux RND transporter permease subunit [Pseudomonadota bacterium]|nr:efflux RND transporter permease subunit [Pseudomonadota bacterium]